MAARVTLTTDFGSRDTYVAAMKGVVLGICPEAQIVDLSHDIPPQSIREGALFVAGAMPYFPAGTIHVVVVDPGVGSQRRAVGVRAGDQYFVCPDNGLLTLFQRQFPVQAAHAIVEPRFRLPRLSSTFHGRDLFAPAAAHLARGVALEEFGPPVDDLVRLELPEPVRQGNAVEGEVIHVDRFGNLISNIPRAMIGDPEGRTIRVKVEGKELSGLSRTYSDVAAGQPLILFGSSDLLEVAVNGGSAAAVLGIAVGRPLRVEWDA